MSGPARPVVRTATGSVPLPRLRPTLAPLAKQSVVAALVTAAAVSSSLLPWLVVSDAVSMWTGVGVALAGLLFAALIPLRPGLARAELLVPALDFVAVGLLRYGTGDSRSVFLAIVVLPVIWIAATPGRRYVVYPLLGTCVTLLLPYLLNPSGRGPSEIVRLVFALVVYTAVAWVTNALSRQAQLQLGHAEDRQRVVQREIDRAATVQQSLLPRPDLVLPAAFTATGVCIPARTVGGDFYDWYPTADGLAFTLGDVMGKGVGAGMIAAAVRSVIRSSVDDPDPAVALRRAAAGLANGGADDADVHFTTCFHARLHGDGSVDWADAGHGLSLVRRADGSIERLAAGNLPIGIGSAWTSDRAVLAPGDLLVSVSDGVLDLFGGDLDALAAFERLTAGHADAEALVAAIGDLASDGDHADDVTVVAVAYTGVDGSVPASPLLSGTALA